MYFRQNINSTEIVNHLTVLCIHLIFLLLYKNLWFECFSIKSFMICNVFDSKLFFMEVHCLLCTEIFISKLFYLILSSQDFLIFYFMYSSSHNNLVFSISTHCSSSWGGAYHSLLPLVLTRLFFLGLTLFLTKLFSFIMFIHKHFAVIPHKFGNSYYFHILSSLFLFLICFCCAIFMYQEYDSLAFTFSCLYIALISPVRCVKCYLY